MFNSQGSGFDGFKRLVASTKEEIRGMPLAQAYKIIKTRQLRISVDVLDTEVLQHSAKKSFDPGRLNLTVKKGLVREVFIG
jgi:hypothetical protein